MANSARPEQSFLDTQFQTVLIQKKLEKNETTNIIILSISQLFGRHKVKSLVSIVKYLASVDNELIEIMMLNASLN